MAKGRFYPKVVGFESHKKAITQVQLSDTCVEYCLTDNNTVISVLASCINLLNKFKKLSVDVEGPAIICHQDMISAKRSLANRAKLYRCRYSCQFIEVRAHGIIFLEVFIKFVPQLKSCRQQHQFAPLVQALLDVEKKFDDVAVDLTFINSHSIGGALKIIRIDQWNLAIDTYQSTISTPKLITAERSFYASVRDLVDVRVAKLRSYTNLPDTQSYLSLVDLFFLQEHTLDSNTSHILCYNQSQKTQFTQISQAVGQWVEKLRKRKSIRYFEGVVVSLKYSEMKGWYASAMLLFNYTGQHTDNLPERVHAAVGAVMEIWNTEINATEGQDGNPIYPHASIHTAAFICPKLPVINSQNSGLYFFSANVPEYHSNEALKPEQEKLKPIVDAFDYLFLSQCFMKYKADSESTENRMIRSYRL